MSAIRPDSPFPSSFPMRYAKKRRKFPFTDVLKGVWQSLGQADGLRKIRCGYF